MKFIQAIKKIQAIENNTSRIQVQYKLSKKDQVGTKLNIDRERREHLIIERETYNKTDVTRGEHLIKRETYKNRRTKYTIEL